MRVHWKQHLPTNLAVCFFGAPIFQNIPVALSPDQRVHVTVMRRSYLPKRTRFEGPISAMWTREQALFGLPGSTGSTDSTSNATCPCADPACQDNEERRTEQEGCGRKV